MRLKFNTIVDNILFFQQYNLVSRREIIIPKCAYFEFVAVFTEYKLKNKKHNHIYYRIKI